MPIHFPGKFRRGWKPHVDAQNHLLELIKKTRTIPVHGFQETANGLLPPRQIERFEPQFSPRIYNASESLGSPLMRLAIAPGYVYGPFNNQTEGDDDGLFHPQLNNFPFAPLIGTDYLTADPAPYLTLTLNSPNFVYLQINWQAHTTPIGNTDINPLGSTEYAINLVDHNLDTDGSPPHNVITGGGDYDIALKMSLRTYHINEASEPTLNVVASDTIPTETETQTNIMAGFYELDGVGKVVTHGWFLEGPVWAYRNPIITDDDTAGADRSPQVPAITTASGTDIPIWEE